MSPRVSAENRDQYLHDRRTHILDAAIQVFCQQGYVATSINDIAQAAGVGKGTIYLYFKSKDDIFNSILVERSFIPHLAELTADNQETLESTLTRVAEEFIQFTYANLAIIRLILTDIYRFPKQAGKVYHEIVQRGVEILAEFLDKQSQEGRIRHLEDPLLTARAFMGMLTTHMMTNIMLGKGNLTVSKRKAWVREIVGLFVRGVQP